jgi:hypothetical protein
MCTIENCEKETHSKGLCQAHYRQELRRARGLKKPGPKPDPTKFRSRHNPDNPSRSREPKGRSLKEECVWGHAYAEHGTVRGDGKRICKECQRIRTEKYRNKVSPDRKRWESKEVRLASKEKRKADKEYRQTHCKRGHEYTEENTIYYEKFRHCRSCSRIRQLERNYGVTEQHVEEMLSNQESSCAICKVPFEGTPRVDHDHETGDVRGLLCHSCNTLLGHAKDSVETLKSAIEYLEKFSDKTAE